MDEVDVDGTQQGIAIIGMAVRLPGAADVGAYWRNLLEGVCSIRKPDDRALKDAGWSADSMADPKLVRAFGVLDGVAEFDARFFGYPPARAEGLDPQQRLLLQVAWHAMEHAGYAPGTATGTVGTYISITQSSYRPRTEEGLADSFFALTSRDKDYAASRIAYKLDLTGPSMMIQSASSGSLAAVHVAVEGLLSGQCDMAIAGGASIALPQGAYRYAPGLMLSPTGTCRAFDASADGAVPGNGVGIVVLKLLSQAMADGDTVYAVIRGTALNNDGAQKSDYLAPSVQGQARVIGEALAVADIDPATVGYIETHGTGTLIGDPIEIRALSRVFRREAFGARRCALGTLKPNIGHLHVASGIAGLIKAALAVHHGVLPPSLNFAAPNPEANLEGTPFYVSTKRAVWESDGPRRAGVSAFGLGGTNVHVVLEQAPEKRSGTRAGGPVALLLSAKTAAARDGLAAALARYLRDTPDVDLADVGWTLAAGRARFEHRLAVLCDDREDAIAALEARRPVDAAATGAMADLAREFLAGRPDAPDRAFASLPRRRIALPPYPFDAVRHWAPAEESAAAVAAPPAAMPTAPVSPASGPIGAKESPPSAERLLPWLLALVGGILRQDAAELDADATYETFGIDSLLVNSITQALQQRFPNLRATALFEHNTLRRLAGHLVADDPESARALSKEESSMAPGRASAARVPDAPVAAIAIVGMAGRYPGAADIDEFWRNLRAGREAISEVPADRWNWREHVDPDRKDRAYTRWGGFISDVDKFDPLFFGIAPREAKLLDPQQRLFLEAAWAAMEEAGYTRRSLKKSAQAAGGDVGVFAGAMHSTYRLLGMDAVAAGQLVQANQWSIANRVSYLFDFTGPSLAVDTACSASLAAVHLACESLRRGECGAAIAGGVSLILHPQQPLELSRAGMLSKGPHCSAFGEAGDGFVQGEGVGVVVLKPLAAAVADGDRIHAVILGSAMNAGGKTSGYTVPNPHAQAEVVESALRQAGVAAAAVGYVECHGTGTNLGDPIEIAGLSDAFRRAGHAGRSCAIGSVKSNIGHLEAAAGIAGLTKTVLQLEHAELVPSLHASPRNPRIDFASSPFQVQESSVAWPAPPDGIRRAGVSSFGAGGANVHVVLEQAPAIPAVDPAQGPWIVPLSARSPERLAVLADALHAALVARPDLNVADVAYTLAVGREAMEARAAFIATDLEDLKHQIRRVAPLPAGPDVSQAQVEQALARRDLGLLARSWMQGAAVDWSRLFAGERRRRVALPTYPFLRERHWLPDALSRPQAPATADLAPAALLGDAIPTTAAEARWRVAVDAESAILSDHRVAGRQTLPGVATIAMAVDAARMLGWGETVSVRDLTWLRPLFAGEGDGAAEFVVREGSEGRRFELVRDGIVHARGRLAAVEPAETPVQSAPDRGREMTGSSLYERLAAGDLVYGPAFRTIETATVDGSQASATARASGAFAIRSLDVGLLDGALQLTAALFDEGRQVLPFAVATVDVLRKPPDRCRLHARRLDDGREGGVVRFDATITDMDGKPCVVFRELVGRVRVGAAAIPPCFEPVWTEQPAAVTARPQRTGTPLLVVGADHAFSGPLQAALPDARIASPADALELPSDTDSQPSRIVFVCDGDADCVDRLFAVVQGLGRTAPVSALDITVLALARGAAMPPWTAAAMGLARVAAREFPSWSVRCVLVDGPDALGDALADRGDPLGREIAWRGNRRFVRALRPVSPGHARPAFRQGGTYLILGGAGGIGLELATHIVTQRGGRVALVGRSAPDAGRQARLAALGDEAMFVAADACRPEDMTRAVGEIRRRFGRIDGAIHSAIVMEDQAIAGMSGARFHAAFDVKTLGTVDLVNALAGERLDWLALFSSANSFAANAGQANYVAGCAFKDAYAAVAASRLGCPVRVINWGFWGEVGRVADPVHRARLERRGVRSIATAEGIAAVERILGGDHDQLLVLKADERVLRELGVSAVAETAGSVAEALAEHAALDALTRRAVACWAAPGMLARERVVPRHRRFHDALLELLSRGPQPAPAGATMAAEEAAFVAAHPDLAPHVRLLRTCIDAYAAILSGETLATDVMFPGSSMAMVEGIYRGDRLTAYCNDAVAREVLKVATSRRGTPLKVLEIGAGTGGTSAAVLEALAKLGAPVEYTYTDVSRAFALHGERTFGARYPFVRFGVLDLGREPEEQGYAARTFDVVLAANVVHVTSDLATSCARLNRLLAPGGSLVLYEMTAVPDFVTATFGLLDGWWAFTDERLAHAPLLDAPGWSRVLRTAGFGAVELQGIGGTTSERYRHTVLTAHGVAEAAHQVPREARVPAGPESPAVEPGGNDVLIEEIRKVVAETLQMRVDQLAVDRNFADYGADSIISVDLIAALNGRFGIRLKPTILFSHPTIKQLAGHLAARGVRVAAARQSARTEGAAVSPDPIAAQEMRSPAVRPGAWSDDIAIVGMSGRFPGAASVETFWHNIENGVVSVGPVPASRWDHTAVYDPNPGIAGKTQCADGGFLDDIESFDPLFFNLSPNEATLMDPQQRLFLQEAWHALEDAGYAGPHPSHAQCGVFVGTVAGDYDLLLRQSGHGASSQAFTGNAASMLAARIAYRLDLRGPCLAVDTACSSSLLAVKLACESLARGECDLALAGGVAVLSTSDFYVAASSAGMLSPTGRCHTLDQAADGFVPGEAAAAVVLKRRSDAERDGDTILALIKAAGSNQDGASNGITAPNGAAQADLLRTIYRRFGIDPASIGYVELHGTGTRLGDPIEMEALRDVLAPSGGRCTVGSVKANIGHTLPAAGIAGLIKLVLALRHRTLPPMAGFRVPNSHIGLDDGALVVPQVRRPWIGAGPLRGAVSSFGFSGTNVHVVIEEAPRRRRSPATSRDWHVAALSAPTEAALHRQISVLAAWLDGDRQTVLADLCGTLARGRSHFRHRAVFIVTDIASLRTALNEGRQRALSGPPAAVEVARRYLEDGDVAWNEVYPDGSFSRISIPGYPFERRRCWPTPASGTSGKLSAAGAAPAVSVPPETAPSARTRVNGSLALFEAVVRDLEAHR
jgi:polyketide synthase PksM/rhizoxin synthesis polyketide synthase/nonribosomal peptide synthetase RhiB